MMKHAILLEWDEDDDQELTQEQMSMFLSLLDGIRVALGGEDSTLDYSYEIVEE